MVVVNDAKNESLIKVKHKDEFVTRRCRDIVNLSFDNLMLNIDITKIAATVASMMIFV